MKIAVVGAGLIGRKHIELIARNAKFQLSAIVNPLNDHTDLRDRPGVRNFTSHRDLIASGCAEAAIVSSPNETHAEIAIDLIEAGLPVLIEKPIAASVEEGLAIEAAAMRCNVPVLVGHHRRHSPIIGEMRKIVDGNDLGRLVGFSGIWATYKPSPYYQTAWRVGPSGGPILINLIHEIDCLQAILGPVDSVIAQAAKKRRPHNSEEALALILGFRNGVIGSLFLSDSAASPWTWEQATGENIPTFAQTGESPYRFLFERGAAEFPRLKIWSQSVPDWTSVFAVNDLDMLKCSWERIFADQIEHFHAVATRQSLPLVSVRDGTEALNAALTVKRAIAEPSKKIPVPRLPTDPSCRF